MKMIGEGERKEEEEGEMMITKEWKLRGEEEKV